MWLAGIDLRLGMLAVPPVIPLIHRDLALDEKAVAALTGLPVLLLGIMAIPGSLMIARIGARRSLVVGLLLIAVASALRGVGPSEPMLFAMTFVMGVGVAIMQPALPTLAGQWFPGAAARATAIYANGLVIGEILPPVMTLSMVLPLVGGDWALDFAVWAAPVLVTAALVLACSPHVGAGAGRPPTLWWPNWRSRETWLLGALIGAGSGTYFGINAFLPDYLHATGRPELVGTCLSWLNVCQLPASLIMLLWARRLAGRRAPMIAIALVCLAGLGALLSGIPWLIVLGSGVLGFAVGINIVLMLALPPLLAATQDVHRLSAGMFTIGYPTAFLIPLCAGAIWDATGIPATGFLPAVIGALLMLGLAFRLRTGAARSMVEGGLS